MNAIDTRTGMYFFMGLSFVLLIVAIYSYDQFWSLRKTIKHKVVAVVNPIAYFDGDALLHVLESAGIFTNFVKDVIRHLPRPKSAQPFSLVFTTPEELGLPDHFTYKELVKAAWRRRLKLLPADAAALASIQIKGLASRISTKVTFVSPLLDDEYGNKVLLQLNPVTSGDPQLTDSRVDGKFSCYYTFAFARDES